MTNYNMQPLYEAIGENLSSNPQFIGLEKYFAKANRITIAGFGNGLSTLLAIKHKPDVITIYDEGDIDLNDFTLLAHDMGIQLYHKKIEVLKCDYIDNTDLLLVDNMREGNYVYSVCQKFERFVLQYILINNTYEYAHKPDPTVSIGNGAQTIGLVFGINHFLQLNDLWHIAENHYWGQGLTILYRRKDYTHVA